MLKPFPFHHKLRDHFKSQDKIWSWFLKQKTNQMEIESFKTDLLKNAYRLDLESNVEIYKILEIAKEKLGVLMPITLYQAQNIDLNNGSIVMFENEAHLIFSGAITKLLNDNELLALFGHELSHIHLYSRENKDFEVTSNIINAIANEPSAELYYHETARLFQLFTELYCDFGGLKATGNIQDMITTLVKINTGLENVSAESYLKQADEIIKRIESGSSGVSHPEIYIRAKALQLLHENYDENISKVETLVFGRMDLHRLHIFSKKEVYEITKSLVDLIIKPKWMQSEYAKVLYKQYFKNDPPKLDWVITETFKAYFSDIHENTKNYFAYVMYDFAMYDHDLTEPALGRILDLAEQLGLEESLEAIIKKEQKLSEKAFKDYVKKCVASLNQILESTTEGTY
jgi:hypothetical protein